MTNALENDVFPHDLIVYNSYLMRHEKIHFPFVFFTLSTYLHYNTKKMKEHNKAFYLCRMFTIYTLKTTQKRCLGLL